MIDYQLKILIVKQTLLVSTIANVSRTVWRICKLMLAYKCNEKFSNWFSNLKQQYCVTIESFLPNTLSSQIFFFTDIKINSDLKRVCY